MPYNMFDNASMEDKFLADRFDEWEHGRGKLNQNYQNFDAPAQAQINDLNRKTESLRTAFQKGRLRQSEFLQAMNNVLNEAQTFKWGYHEKSPGSQVGDIIDDNGVQKIRTEGGMDVLGYSPQYIRDNTVEVGEDSLAVPTSPKSGYTIVKKKEVPTRDIEIERQGIEDAQKQISDRYDQLRTLRMEGRTKPFTQEEESAMAYEASQLYVKQYIQAKHAAKLIADGGIEDPAKKSVEGSTYDPFQRDYERLRNERLSAPDPSMTPQPGPWAPVMKGQAGPEDVEAEVEEAIKQRQIQLAASQAMQKESAVVRSKEWGPQMLFEAAAMDRPLEAYSKDELKTTFKDHKDGTVVALPDGRRYVKDQGRFWEIPFSQAHAAAIAEQRGTRENQRDILAQAMQQTEAGTPGGFTENQFIPTTPVSPATAALTPKPIAAPKKAAAKPAEPSAEDKVGKMLENWQANAEVRAAVERPIGVPNERHLPKIPIGSVVDVKGKLYYKWGPDNYSEVPAPKTKKKAGARRKKTPVIPSIGEIGYAF